MARFYAEIQGNRGQASRMGTTSSGIWGHVREWNVGAKVVCQVNTWGRDEVLIYRTTGSSGHGHSDLISHLIEGERTRLMEVA